MPRLNMFMDYALKNFFETAKKQPWYNNTIFIFTADHSSENTQLYYQTTQGKYAIPLLHLMPQKTQKIVYRFWLIKPLTILA